MTLTTKYQIFDENNSSVTDGFVLRVKKDPLAFFLVKLYANLTRNSTLANRLNQELDNIYKYTYGAEHSPYYGDEGLKNKEYTLLVHHLNLVIPKLSELIHYFAQDKIGE